MSALPRVQPEAAPANAGAQHTTSQLVAGSENGADLAAGPCHGGSSADSATVSDAQAPPSGSTPANQESDTTGSKSYRPPSLVEEDSVSEMASASVSLPNLSDCECTTQSTPVDGQAKSKPDVDAEALVPNLRGMLLQAPQSVSEQQAVVHSADASLSRPPEASLPAAAPPAPAESANRGCKRRAGLHVPHEEALRFHCHSIQEEEMEMDRVSPPLSLNSAPTVIGNQSEPAHQIPQALRKRKFQELQAHL